MERYGLDRDQASGVLARQSQALKIRVRVLARRVIDGMVEGV